MPLRTAKSSTPYIIGSESADAVLTTDFADNSVVFPTERYIGMKLYIKYIPAENTRNCTIQVEFSPDGTDFYIDTSVKESLTGESDILQWTGTIAGATATTEYKRTYRVPVDSSYVRVSVKEDGGVPFGTVAIKAEFRI